MFDLVPTKPINCLIPSSGHIQVIFGPMFSGKTTELIRRLKRYKIANHTCLIVKYAHDIRYSTSSIVTHDKQAIDAISRMTLKELLDEALQYSVIGIDEGQFFPDIIDFAEELANKGKIVIVAALDGTYKQEAFGDILNLIPIAESVMKLTAVCMTCFENASYTKRTGCETELEVIGGSDKYMAVCRSCNNKILASQKNLPTNVLCDISSNQGMKINAVEKI